MNLKKICYDNKTIILRGIVIVITFLVTIILPVYVYLETLSLNHDPYFNISSYINRLERNTLQNIIIGVIIMILLVISFFINSFSRFKMMFSILIKILYIHYIIITSNSEIFEIIAGNIYLKVYS